MLTLQRVHHEHSTREVCVYLLGYILVSYGGEWSLSTRDKFDGMGPLSLIQWSLSTRDKFGMDHLSLIQWSLYTRDKLGTGPLSLVVQRFSGGSIINTYLAFRVCDCFHSYDSKTSISASKVDDLPFSQLPPQSGLLQPRQTIHVICEEEHF